ncbi:uncharacterized protein LOC115921109 [Strongylocentrotus purpuratus]|uniref:Uncharacterized protein n=1 Tax=Strongylocentrotus purpuratus TaxID=7668 RepID=A0A7M7NDF6_STRPU|nr:uncharacterized protein LOC115921109 [Strongylocentrotus purpuratus]
MPNLTHLTLSGKDFKEEFYSTLNAKASTLQVQTLELWDVQCPTSASSINLAEALCSMPKLTDLTLYGKDFQEEFFATLNSKVLQVQTLKLWEVQCPTSASSINLAEALCSMPNLTHLKLRGKDFQEEFFATLNAKALQGSFPQISNGNFRFNEVYQADFVSFLKALTDFQSVNAHDLSDKEDEPSGTSQPSEHLQEDAREFSDDEDEPSLMGSSVQPSKSHSRIRCCLII